MFYHNLSVRIYILYDTANSEDATHVYVEGETHKEVVKLYSSGDENGKCDTFLYRFL